MSKQKALIVRIRPESTHGLDELNVELGRGWRVAKVTPMGGAGVGGKEDQAKICLAALVIIEREENKAAAVMEEAEEETEELVEEIVEGPGLSEESLSEELEEERNGGSNSS